MEYDKGLTLTHTFELQYGPHGKTHPQQVLEGLIATEFYIQEIFLGGLCEISRHRPLAWIDWQTIKIVHYDAKPMASSN